MPPFKTIKSFHVNPYVASEVHRWKTNSYSHWNHKTKFVIVRKKISPKSIFQTLLYCPLTKSVNLIKKKSQEVNFSCNNFNWVLNLKIFVWCRWWFRQIYADSFMKSYHPWDESSWVLYKYYCIRLRCPSCNEWGWFVSARPPY